MHRAIKRSEVTEGLLRIELPPHVVFPNDGDGGGPRMMLVAIGPEGGWEEPHELDMFKQSGFQRVLLGSRVLRSDVRS